MTERDRPAATVFAATDGAPLPLSRRQFLGTASGAAIAGATGLLSGCVKPPEEPWSDGTYWSDNTGWTEHRGFGWGDS